MLTARRRFKALTRKSGNFRRQFEVPPGAKKAAPAVFRRGDKIASSREASELVADLVGPEALKTNQSLVERLQLVRADAADLLQ
jgi:hypothetical protein